MVTIKASLIVPIWNKAHLTHDFLSRHWLFFRNYDLEIIVIDNGSTDNTRYVIEQWLGRWDERLVIISNEENRGFGPANNQGAAMARSNVLVFISNDVIAGGDYVTPIIEAVERYPTALVGPELLDRDTGWNVFDGQMIPYLAGHCIAMTKETFDSLGGWDERYIPSDYEDIDLSYTATQQGRQLIPLFLPLEHISGASGTQLPDRMAMTERHRILFAKKWRFNEPIKITH